MRKRSSVPFLLMTVMLMMRDDRRYGEGGAFVGVMV